MAKNDLSNTDTSLDGKRTAPSGALFSDDEPVVQTSNPLSAEDVTPDEDDEIQDTSSDPEGSADDDLDADGLAGQEQDSGEDGEEEPEESDAGDSGDNSGKDWERRYNGLVPLLNRQAEELGRLRQQVAQLSVSGKSAQSGKLEVDDSEFDLDNPDDRRKYREALMEANRLEAQQIVRQEIEKEKAVLELERAHPDRQEIVSSPEFVDWARGLPRSLIIEADNDPRTARQVFDMFKERKAVGDSESVTGKAKQKKRDTARSASSLGGGSGKSSDKIFTREELRLMQVTDPQKYERLQPQIIKAYKEGRVR